MVLSHFQGCYSQAESQSCSPSSSPTQNQGKNVSMPWHLALSACDRVFPQHLLQGCSELSGICELILTSPCGRICTAHLLPHLHINYAEAISKAHSGLNSLTSAKPQQLQFFYRPGSPPPFFSSTCLLPNHFAQKGFTFPPPHCCPSFCLCSFQL